MLPFCLPFRQWLKNRKKNISNNLHCFNYESYLGSRAEQLKVDCKKSPAHTLRHLEPHSELPGLCCCKHQSLLQAQKETGHTVSSASCLCLAGSLTPRDLTLTKVWIVLLLLLHLCSILPPVGAQSGIHIRNKYSPFLKEKNVCQRDL